jgi:hypothetical protein
VAFGALLAVAWLALGLGPSRALWPWLLLVPLPVLVLWLQADQRRLRRVFAEFLDKVAADLGLHVLPPSQTPASPPNPGAPG